MNDKLSKSRVAKLIRDMRPGETGYTVPWAMEVDLDFHGWLRTYFTVSSRPVGTLSMLVRRSNDGKNFSVDIELCKDSFWVPGVKTSENGMARVLEIIQ